MSHLVWNTYTNSNLDTKGKAFYTASSVCFFLPHGDILIGPRHQLLIINISHLLSHAKHYWILSVWWQIRISVNGNECLYLHRVNTAWGICYQNVFCVYHQFQRLNSLHHMAHHTMIKFTILRNLFNIALK